TGGGPGRLVPGDRRRPAAGSAVADRTAGRPRPRVARSRARPRHLGGPPGAGAAGGGGAGGGRGGTAASTADDPGRVAGGSGWRPGAALASRSAAEAGGLLAELRAGQGAARDPAGRDGGLLAGRFGVAAPGPCRDLRPGLGPGEGGRARGG